MNNVYLLFREGGSSIPELIFNELDNLYYYLSRNNAKVNVEGSEDDSLATLKNIIEEKNVIAYVTVIRDEPGMKDRHVIEHYVVLKMSVRTNPNPNFW